jgi:hypothetical protein
MPRERKGQPPSRDEAEALAIRALAYLAGDNRRLARFLELSGLEPGSLRGAASSPHFLAAVLDHILGEEALLLAFARAEAIRPESIAESRRALGTRPG